MQSPSGHHDAPGPGPDPESERRTRFVVAIGVGLPPIALLFAGVVLHGGRPWVAVGFVVLALSTLACVAWRRRGGSAFAVGNTLAALLEVALGVIVGMRGTIGVPAAMMIAAVPAVATFVAGWRSGLAWMLASLGVLGAVVAAPSLGVPLHDLAGAREAHVLAMIGPPFFVIFMSLVSFAYDATRTSVLVEKRASDAARAEAVAEVQLAQSNRLAAVGHLAASMAHEVNNPLAAVKANLSFVEERLRELGVGARADELHRALAEADEAVIRVDRIVKDLRTFSRVEVDAPSMGDAVSAMRSALKLATTDLQHRARLEVDLPAAEALPVPIDEGRLVQVFLNLLVNAAQALVGPSSGQTVRVRVARHADGRAIVEVEDSGTGVPSEALSRVFEPFFTTKPIGAGMGLGLTVCRNIVERAGGTIALETSVGRGTCVRIVLPPAAVGDRVVERPPAAAQPPPAARTILVIDDDDAVRRALCRTLRGHTVVDVPSAGDALALLRERHDFDLVLCDIMMPELDGAEFFEMLSAFDPDLAERVVFVTGGELTDRARSLVDRHPTRVVYKPFDPHALREVVRTMTAAARPRSGSTSQTS